MPTQTALPITVVKQNNYAVVAADLVFVETALDAANGNYFPMTGKELLYLHNTDASPHTVTLTSLADALGRLDISLTGYSIPANTFCCIDVSQLLGWKQTDGNLYMATNSALIKAAVLRHP